MSESLTRSLCLPAWLVCLATDNHNQAADGHHHCPLVPLGVNDQAIFCILLREFCGFNEIAYGNFQDGDDSPVFCRNKSIEM